MKAKYHNILAVVWLISMAIPLFTLFSHHDCGWDKCLHIYFNDNVGMCVQKAIDNLYAVLVSLWFIANVLALDVWYKDPHAVSPFVFMVFLAAIAVAVAFVDPAKWSFVIALIPSVIILTIIMVIYKKELKDDKN